MQIRQPRRLFRSIPILLFGLCSCIRHGRQIGSRPRRALSGVILALSACLPLLAQNWDRPTYSSPIAISRNDKLIFSVNPGDDSISAIRPDNNTLITKISVGDEPQSIALTPDGQFVYVANAAGNSVSILRIDDPVWGSFKAHLVSTLTTGAEPWNIVSSPDGKRIFVANSMQDTISVIDTANQSIIGHVDLRTTPGAGVTFDRHFQPRGLAVTADGTKLYVTRFLSYTRPDG